MGSSREIKDFLAAFSAGRKMFDTSDDDYKRARTELLKEQVKQIRDPETARGRKLINDARAGAIARAGDPEIRRGRKLQNDMREWLLEQYKNGGSGGPDATKDYDATMGGTGAPAAAPKPQSALPVTPGSNQASAEPDQGDEAPTQMADNPDDDLPDVQNAAEGGLIERPTTNGQRQRQDYSEDADKVAAGAGALPVPEYLGAIERMHKTRSKNYAEGGAVDDNEPDDNEPGENDPNEGDEGEGQEALPLSASPTAGRTPAGDIAGFSRAAAQDAVFAGQLYNMKRFGLNRPAAVGSPDRVGRVRAYAVGAGAVDPQLFQHVTQVVDPKGELPEGERNMKAIGSIWQYYVKKRDFPKAQAAAGEMVQYFRGASQRYASLAAAAAKGGNADAAAQFLARAYANVPDGRELRIVSRGQQGPGIADSGQGIAAEYVDDSGKVVSKELLTPEQIAQDAMKLANPATFDQLMDLAGKPIKPGKPARSQGSGAPKLADREKALKMVDEGTDPEAGAAEGADSTKAVAAAVLQANDLDPSRAKKIAQVLLDPVKATKIQPNQDGSYTALFDGGQQIKIPQMAFLEMMDARGKAMEQSQKNQRDTEEATARTTARKDVQDREDAAIKKVRDKTYTPERVSAARNPGKYMARRQREESPDQRELATADEE
ncbi:MAG: hypothetical protein ACXWP0_16365 [Ktedonobacterales bacterium]